VLLPRGLTLGINVNRVAVRRAAVALAALLSSAAATPAIEPQEPSDQDGVEIRFPGRLPAHQFSPDGTLLATASLDG
jgi:hypothetical protein